MSFTTEEDHITMLRDTIRRFVDAELPREKVQQWEREHHSPPEIFRKLADLGVCGLTVPEEFGGQGREIMAGVAVIDELSRRGMALSGPFIHCAFYGGLNISAHGTEAQKQAMLPRIARGELLFSYGLSEPDVGSDLAAVTVRARLSDDGQTIIINGTKRWCTFSERADYIILLVNSDPNGERYKNLSLVLVPPKTPGITLEPMEHMNIRYTLSNDVIFDDVRVPVDNLLGGRDAWNRGWPMLAGEVLDIEKLEITAVAYGVAAAAVDEAWQYSQERRQFGKPICAHQAVRHQLVDAKTKLQACRHMLYHATWLAHTGQPCSVEASMAKLFIADTGVEIVLTCQQVMGAYGLAEGYDMERHVRDMVGMPIVGGSSNIQKNNIANRLRLPYK